MTSTIPMNAAAQIEWLKQRLADLQLPTQKHADRENWLLDCGMPPLDASKEPVAWQWKILDTWHTAEIDRFDDAEKYARAVAGGGEVRAIYTAPAHAQPIAGASLEFQRIRDALANGLTDEAFEIADRAMNALAPATLAVPGDVVGQERIGRFGWHPDPAIDFEIEVGDIEAEIYHHKVGFENGTPPLNELVLRIERAMSFRVGAVETCVLAKSRLRELEKEAAAIAGVAALPAPGDAVAVREFANAILHGDDEHRAWLTEAADAFIEGRPLPPPRGKGTAISGVAALPVQVDAVDGAVHRIEHDGFEGTVQGSYVTREGKRGVVLQQVGTKVVHVYGEKWLPASGHPSKPAIEGVEARKAEQMRAEREWSAFQAWWKSSGHAADPTFTLTMENCAHAAWQARAIALVKP